MEEVYRTSNPAEIALLKSAFGSARIKFFVFDENMNSLGIAGGFSPCRFMVVESSYDDAREIIKEYGLEATHKDGGP